MPPTDGPILDVGCGGALFGRLLAERATGYSDWIIRGRRRVSHGQQNRVPVVAGIFSDPPFEREFFAAITMFHVLEHLYDPGSYIQTAWHLLRPGGRLIVQVPNASSWQFLLFGEHWNGLDVPRHLINFRADDLQAFSNRMRFNDAEEQSTFHFVTIPPDSRAAWRHRSIRWLGEFAAVIESERCGCSRIWHTSGLVVAALPFTLLEAACGAGSTVMMEAVKPE